MQNRKNPIGIIAAMKIEAEGILRRMTDVTAETVSGVTFSSGKLHGVPCVVAVCGIGKVFAALCAQTMILRYQPCLILNSGVAGSLSASLTIGDIAVAESLVQHDMDTSALGDPVGLISGINIVHLPCDEAASARLAACAASLEGVSVKRGVIASGDQFMSDGEKKRRIADTFGAVACEMEGAAIGQVCYVNAVPCAVMRAISDGGDEAAAMDYPTFAKMAAERAVEAIDRYFAELAAEG
jgi:adenosylhomocysteine nucleosidase